MQEIWRWSNLGLAFVVELAGLGIFALWGWRTGGSTPTRLLLAIGLPLVAAVLWGLFAAPTANYGSTGNLSADWPAAGQNSAVRSDHDSGH
jgi:hypothetical protein